MPHLVRDWMSSPVVVVDPDTTVSYAMTLMRRRNIHSVIVELNEKNKEYGIVTTTDIRDKIVAVNRNAAETHVRDIMSGPVVTGKAEWTLAECSRVMQEKKFHHLPITDEHGTLSGMISATDIFMAVEEAGWEEPS
ncbi:MAG: Inosine-5'-monophosphate dehydrogenase [Anaerolineales bacterium]|nr:CBS domain-containing protein [Anaerolineae bacterium]MBL8104113.1 CBS domain-containing protein [Anaerolineales bacterium]MBV6401185.1 Inosine-5'-monophosphate dehydrogenase [Anaerolineales bacterium]MCC7190969.1 CBS domain-containing protein [Anaerolineales bacterium]HQU36187.1 CBS domain-containing protein [Anaerolineales bacterium]